MEQEELTDIQKLLNLLQGHLVIDVERVYPYDPFGDHPDPDVRVRVLFDGHLISEDST